MKLDYETLMILRLLHDVVKYATYGTMNSFSVKSVCSRAGRGCPKLDKAQVPR
ncbi:hypothetical protein KCP74_06205 [Salmonella enterica subsp. enterica]|nr:hypothetical protein KCP74_06205 [Salmonella enterica subsp. enterica]